jgi:hypothetical protein
LPQNVRFTQQSEAFRDASRASPAMLRTTARHLSDGEIKTLLADAQKK